jgi:hypothetical protein
VKTSNLTKVIFESKISLTKHHAMKIYGGANVEIHVFLTSALVGSDW